MLFVNPIGPFLGVSIWQFTTTNKTKLDGLPRCLGLIQCCDPDWGFVTRHEPGAAYRETVEGRARPAQPVSDIPGRSRDSVDRDRERAERKRLEEHEVKNRQRPRNTVEVGES